MGYEATFSFDLTIPAKHVEAAEEIMTERADSYWMDDGDDFCSMFRCAWGEDVVAEEKTPPPLAALASGEVRGNIEISGVAYRKWRSWEEPLLDTLAPYIQDGGSISVEGEDDYATTWEFEGGVRYIDDQIRVSDRHYKRLVELLTEARKQVNGSLGERIDKALGEA
jgi:hypothetical protein